MSISDKEEPSDIIPEQNTSIDNGNVDDLDPSPEAGTSEVTMRINLLGKLIIPPSAPRA
jgi:hypothetical protein